MLPDFPATAIANFRDLLLFYAECGMTYAVLSEILHLHHNILLSANAICKRLKRYGLQCRRGPVSITQQELQSIVLDKLKLLPKTVGYRQLTDLLKQEGHHGPGYDYAAAKGFGCSCRAMEQSPHEHSQDTLIVPTVDQTSYIVYHQYQVPQIVFKTLEMMQLSLGSRTL
ncbi:hypothetical protein KUTeg_022402 [Tegillarca granosa]|uniref:Clr5 domain-containing protein n=1 Tax=Tegillarca granosa TaxID=220873 RepID=A0ABQ9ECA2_TEGGR|nr:hypothetical protein KUTeg_022402 [Tegillarca granosa]